MLVWRDIGFKKNETGRDHERVSDLATGYVRRISQLPSSGNPYDASSMASVIIQEYKSFCEETKTILRWDDVPKSKQRVDHEQFMRAMFLVYGQPFHQSTEDVD